MIRYILVDDNPNTLTSVKTKIDTIAQDYDLQHIQSYSSSKKAFEEVIKSDFDLLIVDFEMPVYNGLELSKKIASTKKIIFLTSTIDNEKKIINSLDISGYLSKPFDIEEFEIILKNKIIGKIKINNTIKKGDLITLSVGVNKDIGFYPDKTLYISTSRNTTNQKKPNKNCVNIYGENDKITSENIRIKINDLSAKLKPYGFEKINASTIINTSFIKVRENKDLSLHKCRETFEISTEKKKSFIDFFRAKIGL